MVRWCCKYANSKKIKRSNPYNGLMMLIIQSFTPVPFEFRSLFSLLAGVAQAQSSVELFSWFLKTCSFLKRKLNSGYAATDGTPSKTTCSRSRTIAWEIKRLQRLGWWSATGGLFMRVSRTDAWMFTWMWKTATMAMFSPPEQHHSPRLWRAGTGPADRQPVGSIQTVALIKVVEGLWVLFDSATNIL